MVLFLSSHVQLVDITGKDQDESMIALHDCNGDVNRAINVLLEGSPDTVSDHCLHTSISAADINNHSGFNHMYRVSNFTHRI